MKLMAKKILIIDDDKDIVELLTYNLEKTGFSCTGILDGNNTLELAKSIKPDVILLDLMLPGLSGLDILYLLKRNMQLHKTPVIIISALNQKERISNSFKLGASEYVIKPFQISELVKLINKTIKNPVRLLLDSFS